MSALALRLLVVVSGIAVMAVEMSGLRLLAPFFGTSLLVTTILIGSMMAFLSLGYWLGGRQADRYPNLHALTTVTGVAGALVLAIPFVGQPILRAAAEVMRPLLQGAEIAEPQVALATIVGGMLGVLALFALPVTLMGMVSPWAARLVVAEGRLEETGRAVGRLYALSTFGSIAGSFLPALALIPLLGVRNTFVLIGGSLIVASALARFGARGMGAAAVGLLALLPSSVVRPMDGLVIERESIYHFIQVVVEPYGKCKEANHLYLNEGVGVHSVKCLDPKVETRGTWAYMASAPLWLDQPESVDRVMIVGLAGGTIARQLLEAFPGAQVDGVEIDGAVVEVGKEYFDNDDARIHPYVMDGRIFLQVTQERYDVVLMDAYRQPYIPFHLTTVEFWREVDAVLADDAVVGINVASVRGVSDELTRMIYRTMREVFPMVVHVDATSSNDVLFALKRSKPLDTQVRHLEVFQSVRGLDQLRGVLTEKTKGELDGWRDARVLTDDQAPVEMVWDLMALQYAG